MLTQALALQMWCLATPPPKMIIPEELAATAVLFILDMSEVKHVSLDQLKVHLQMIAPVQKKKEEEKYLRWCLESNRGSQLRRDTENLLLLHLSGQDWTLGCHSATQLPPVRIVIALFHHFLFMHLDHCGWKHMGAGVHLVGPVAHRFRVVDLLS